VGVGELRGVRKFEAAAGLRIARDREIHADRRVRVGARLDVLRARPGTGRSHGAGCQACRNV
jgi:hypothetical protein